MKVILHQKFTFNQFLLRLLTASENTNKEAQWDMKITDDVELSDQNTKIKDNIF